MLEAAEGGHLSCSSESTTGLITVSGMQTTGPLYGPHFGDVTLGSGGPVGGRQDHHIYCSANKWTRLLTAPFVCTGFAPLNLNNVLKDTVGLSNERCQGFWAWKTVIRECCGSRPTQLLPRQGSSNVQIFSIQCILHLALKIGKSLQVRRTCRKGEQGSTFKLVDSTSAASDKKRTER